MTVILTGLAMFAFIILGAIDTSSAPQQGGPTGVILGACLFAGAFWIWAWGTKKPNAGNMALWGAVVGAAVGLVPAWLQPGQTGIATAAGTVSANDLAMMKRERELANQIVVAAFRERENAFNFMLQQYTFGGTTNREIIARYLLLNEADKLGVNISDEYVGDFLNGVAENGLSRKEFVTIRSQLSLGESELYDILRNELRARTTLTLLNPEVLRMPEEYWADFGKLNFKSTVDAAAIPVSAFVEKSAGGAEAEGWESRVKDLFELHKASFPFGGTPGFYQPDRVQLAWFQIEQDRIEASIPDPTAEELQAKYDELKESLYRIETLPDQPSEEPGKPEEPPLPEPASKDEPASEGNPVLKVPDAPKNDGDDAKPADSNPGEPEKPADGIDQPAKSTPDGCAVPQDEETEKADSDAGAKAENLPADPAEEKGDAAEVGDKANEAEVPAAAEPEDAKPEVTVTYKPFDDLEVQDDLDRFVREEKARARMEEMAAAAASAVRGWRDEIEEAQKVAVREKKQDPYTDKQFIFVPPAQPEIPDFDPFRLPAGTDTDDKKSDDVKSAAPKDDSPEKDDSDSDKSEPDGEGEPENGDGESEGDADSNCQDEAAESESPADDDTESAAPKFEEPADEEVAEEREQLDVVLTGAAAEIAERASAYAAEHGLQFFVTEPLSEQELIEHQDYDIGTAQDPNPDFAAMMQSRQMQVDTVTTMVFSGTRQEFAPNEAVAPFGQDPRYVFWTMKFVGAHVPTLDEPGIREQVAAALRLQDARPKAEERAKKIAEGVAKPVAEKSLGELVKDEIVASDGSDPINVVGSIPFSWLQSAPRGMQMNALMGGPQITLGTIPGIDGVDNDFMKTIYGMKVGDVATIPNADKSVYYVVHLKSRTPSGVDENEDPMLGMLRGQFLAEEAPFSPQLLNIARADSGNIHQRWFADFMARHGVDLPSVDQFGMAEQ